MAITKSELIDHLSTKLNLPRAKAEQMIDIILDCMITQLKAGDGIEIRGFGSFSVREYKGYDGRNPRTGEKVAVREKRLPFFKVGKELRQRINDSREGNPLVVDAHDKD
jgi:integration host factor subunit beta